MLKAEAFVRARPYLQGHVATWLGDTDRQIGAALCLLASPRLELCDHLNRQIEFSEKTFGPGTRTAGILDHIRKELIEIESAPNDLTEWIDVVILAFDGAWRAGYLPEQIVEALVAKQTKNEARKWPDWRTADPNKAIEHDRGEVSP